MTAEDLTSEQLMLATPLLYGFSLSDKMWRKSPANLIQPSHLLTHFSTIVAFKVESAKEIKWQEDAFNNLVLPSAQKSLIQALVQSHTVSQGENGFDDFIQGKGKGLIINLFGPPGVGKTLSAEATSECEYSTPASRSCVLLIYFSTVVRRPLYVVGVGEFGRNVEDRLKTIFDVASFWQAIVLIGTH